MSSPTSITLPSSSPDNHLPPPPHHLPSLIIKALSNITKPTELSILSLLEPNGKMKYSVKYSVATHFLGEEMGKRGYELFGKSAPSVLMATIVSTTFMIILLLGLVEVIPKYMTIVGVLGISIQIIIELPFIIQWRITKLTLFSINSCLYQILTIIASVSFSMCINWDERSSIIVAFYFLVAGTMVNDAMAIMFLRYIWILNVCTGSLFGLITALITLGHIKDMSDVTFLDLGTLGGLSAHDQSYSALQLSVSSFFTLFVLFFRMAIHNFAHRSHGDDPLMHFITLPVYVMEGDLV
jgi:hypothetical protein